MLVLFLFGVKMEFEDAIIDDVVIEAIVMDLTDMMVPAQEARERALAFKDVDYQEYMKVKFRMQQAFVILKKMGYICDG